MSKSVHHPFNPPFAALAEQTWNGGDFTEMLPYRWAENFVEHFRQITPDAMHDIHFALEVPKSDVRACYTARESRHAASRLEEYLNYLEQMLALCEESWRRWYHAYSAEELCAENVED